MGEEQKKEGQRLEGQKRLGELINQHYQEALEIQNNKSRLVAWSTTGAPNELLWAMDIYVQYPEAYAATCGGRHAAHDQCIVAEREGFERHLCTYCRNSLGATVLEVEGNKAFAPLAKPDFLFVASNTCILVTKWWENLSEYWNIPLFNIDCPLIFEEIGEAELIAYVKKQCEDLVAFLEKLTGKKMDYDRLKEIVANGKEAAIAYREMFDTNMHDPAPATYFDLMAHNFPNLVLRYKPETVDHYRKMKAELEDRIAKGINAFPQMKYRVYWDGIPYWFAMKNLSEKLKSLGMCLVASNYTEIFAYDRLDPQRPLDSIAETTALQYLNRSVSFKLERTKEIFRSYKVDAGIFAYAQSCKPSSISMHFIADKIRTDMGIPVAMIEGDLVDETFYNEERNNIRMEALAESLQKAK